MEHDGTNTNPGPGLHTWTQKAGSPILAVERGFQSQLG